MSGTPTSTVDGKTVLTRRRLHPTVEQRDATAGFGAVEPARHLVVA